MSKNEKKQINDKVNHSKIKYDDKHNTYNTILITFQIRSISNFFLSLLFEQIKFEQKQRSAHAQVRWRQQTLPAVYFEDHVGHQSLTEYPTSPLATTTTAAATGAREKSQQIQGNVKWSYSIQSSHGTSIHSSFDTLEGTNKPSLNLCKYMF